MPLSTLSPATPIRPRTGRRRPRRGRLFAGIVLLLLVALGAWKTLPGLTAASDARGQARALQDAARALVGTTSLPTAAQIAALDDHTTRLAADLRALRETWSFWRGPALLAAGSVPVVRQLDALLDYGDALSSAGHHLSDPLADLVTLGQGSSLRRAVPSVVARLAAARPALLAAAADLDRAIAARAHLDPATLPAQVGPGLRSLDEFLPAAPAAVRSLAALPAALGADGPRDYLVAPQNSLDLRASGGFIGTIGFLRADHGHITLHDFGSSYLVDSGKRPDVSPPDPWHTYAQGAWYFRDANWSADFPTTAQLLEAFYTLPTHRYVDGVIALDTELAPRLLALTGPIELPKFRARLTADNALIVLDYLVNGSGGPHTKEAATLAYSTVFGRLLTLPSSALPHALRTFAELIRGRNLLLYANDATVQGAIRSARADGAIDPTTGDYLFVVDTNTSANKVNDRVYQRIAYRAVVQPDRAILATLTLTYTNTADRANTPPYRLYLGPPNNGRANYGDFVRVFVPAGSRLLTGAGFDQPWPTTMAHGKTQFSGYLALESHQTRVVTLRYRVPANAAAGRRYTLLVQRQSGSFLSPLEVAVAPGPGVSLGTGPVALTAVLDRDLTISAPLSGGAPRLQVIPQVAEAPVAPGSHPEIWVTVPVRNVPAPRIQ